MRSLLDSALGHKTRQAPDDPQGGWSGACLLSKRLQGVQWPDPDLNRGHLHFQCSALPTELPGRVAPGLYDPTGGKDTASGLSYQAEDRAKA